MSDKMMLKKVLFCTDFSDNAMKAFRIALAVLPEGGELHFMHVLPINPYYHPEFISFISPLKIQDFHQQLRDRAEKTFREQYLPRAGGVKIEMVVREGKEAQEIVNYAVSEKMNLIVMGTHGVSGLEHAFMGSIAEKVLRSSPIPVMVVPPERAG
jgi:nucleotide-binding universal stress UspA family protein